MLANSAPCNSPAACLLMVLITLSSIVMDFFLIPITLHAEHLYMVRILYTKCPPPSSLGRRHSTGKVLMLSMLLVVPPLTAYTHDPGGYGGETIFLPATISLFDITGCTPPFLLMELIIFTVETTRSLINLAGIFVSSSGALISHILLSLSRILFLVQCKARGNWYHSNIEYYLVHSTQSYMIRILDQHKSTSLQNFKSYSWTWTLLIVARKLFVFLFVVPIHWMYLMCLEIVMIYKRLLTCSMSIPNVTFPYLSMILGGMFVIKLLSQGILFFLCTVFPSTAVWAGPKMTLAILTCLLSIPHSLIPPLSITSARSTLDGRHRHF